MDLYFEIKKLIKSKREGNYWDFKREPHKNKDDLLHDIICLSNTKHNGDRYLIIGVADPADNCEIIGLENNTPNRKKECDLNDFLSNKPFAGGNIPKINVRTLNFEGKEIDIIIIKNSHKKPFYLEKNYLSVKPYHIYTRTGDKNTAIDKSANYFDIKEMWEENFGINMGVEQKLKIYLKDINGWVNEFETKEFAYYKYDPNFTIELSDFERTDYVEPFNAFYLDNSCLFGDLVFKYNSTKIYQCKYFYCDGGRILIPEPKLCMIENKDWSKIGFYYYNLEEIEGLFAIMLTEGNINFKGRIKQEFPFIIILNYEMLNKFKDYLKDNIDNLKKSEKLIINKTDPNKYTSSVDLEKLNSIKLLYDKWVETYLYEEFNFY